MGKAAVRSHQPIGMARANLDEIAQHAIVADLEARDSRLLAIARLHRGNRPARIARGGAQLVERGVIAIGDEAAAGAFRGRGGHQRARQPVGHRAVAGQAGEHLIEQCRTVGRAGKPVMQPCRFGEPVAQLAEITRTSAPRHHPSERPPEIGDGAQDVTQLRPFDRPITPELHQRQPRLDRRDVEQRGRQILRQQPRARAGDAAVHRADQAAGSSAGGGFEDFEARPRGLVHRHAGFGGTQDGRQQQGQAAASDVFEIGDQAARRRQHRTGEIPEGIECRDPMHRL